MVIVDVGEVKINTEGREQRPKVLIPEDSYESEIVKISDVFESDWQGNKKDKTPIEFKVKADNKEVILTMYPTTVISAARGTNSPSKGYELLVKADKLDDFLKFAPQLNKVSKEEHNRLYVKFLNDNFVGRKCKVLVKTTTAADGKKYSSIKEVVRFLDNVEKVKV